MEAVPSFDTARTSRGRGRKRSASKVASGEDEFSPEDMCPLFKTVFPAEVGQLLWGTLLSVEDLHAMDCAVTNYKARKIWFGICSSLTGIFADDYRHTAKTIQWSITRNVKLRSLSFKKMAKKSLTADLVAQLKSTMLTTVNMSHMGPTLTDKAFTGFVKNHPRLQTVKVGGTKLKNKSVIALGKSCPHLETVYLHNCAGVGDRGVTALVQCCTDLKALDLSGTSVTDISALKIADCCPSLEIINLSRVSSLSDDGLMRIASTCTALESIVVACDPDCYPGSTRIITDLSLYTIASHCSKLKIANFNRTDVTADGVVTLLEACEVIERIYVEDNANIDGPAIVGIGCSARLCGRLSTLKMVNVKGNGISIEDAVSFKRECPFVLLGEDLLDRGLDLLLSEENAG